MAFAKLNELAGTKPAEPKVESVSPEHQANLGKIADYSKRLGFKPENLSHHFGDFEKDEAGNVRKDDLGRPVKKFVPYSEFSKDPVRTAEYVKSFSNSVMPSSVKPLSAAELREANVTPNYYDDLNEIVGDYKDEGIGSFIADYADDLEEDKALYTAIQNSVSERVKIDSIEDALGYLYNASPEQRGKIQNEYNRILTTRVGKSPAQTGSSRLGFEIHK